jgi:hypothetical protein
MYPEDENGDSGKQVPQSNVKISWSATQCFPSLCFQNAETSNKEIKGRKYCQKGGNPLANPVLWSTQ